MVTVALMREGTEADTSWARSWEDSGTLPPILKAKALSGVKVYILLYNQVDLVAPCAPVVDVTIEYLEKLHPNIRWSHPLIVSDIAEPPPEVRRHRSVRRRARGSRLDVLPLGHAPPRPLRS